MTSRELLELAAKAAKIELVWNGEKDPWCFAERFPGIKWNPLTDDGDALRLAVKLFLHIHVYDGFTEAQGDYRPLGEEHYDDPSAATRRAIVRAAAEIGMAMK